jgi:pimeloyl-ACP methyl ester carboxylesterase
MITTATKPTFVLVHGSWQAGWCWAGVQDHLEQAGYCSVAPDLPGHSPDDDRRAVAHDDYVDTVLAALQTDVDGPVVLVGHSFGGSVVSRVAERLPERCHSLIYMDAFVPLDGECVADILPPPFVDMLAQLSAASPDGSVALPFEAFHQGFANTLDEATARVIFERFTPEPYRPIFDRLELPTFVHLGLPATYITLRDDRAMPPGLFRPGQSSRLRSARVIELEGDHEAMLTAPGRVAGALLEATEAVRRRSFARDLETTRSSPVRITLVGNEYHAPVPNDLTRKASS